MNELRLKIKLEGKDARERDTLGSSSKLSILDDTHPEPQHIDFGA
jgi:hypothetical protein